MAITLLLQRIFFQPLHLRKKNSALTAIAKALRENSNYIIEENKKDLEHGENAGLSPAMLDRLMLDKDRIEGIAKGVEDVVALPDPCGLVLDKISRPNGLEIEKNFCSYRCNRHYI